MNYNIPNRTMKAWLMLLASILGYRIVRRNKNK
nr:MAG TPA: hypothetical protein [Caudoviricetes sp.]